MSPSLFLTRGLAACALAVLAACASAPDRYYTLAAPAGAAPAAAAAPGAPTLAVEFAPVAVPERLARPQMVVRRSGDAGAEVRVLEQHRWAASLEQELRDALAAGVAQALGAADVTRTGRAPGQAVWRVAVQLQALDAVEGEGVGARLQWRLRRPDGSDAGACTWSAREGAGPGIEALAQGAQRLTAQAAEAIARQIVAGQAGQAPAC